MTAAELCARYVATEAELQAYVDTLPLWVNVWRGWMFGVFGLAIVFVIWKREARWLAAVMVVSILAYNVVAMFTGVGRLPSIAFVLLWSPLALYLGRRRAGLARTTRFDRVYAIWLSVSLAFDVYNVGYALLR